MLYSSLSLPTKSEYSSPSDVDLLDVSVIPQEEELLEGGLPPLPQLGEEVERPLGRSWNCLRITFLSIRPRRGVDDESVKLMTNPNKQPRGKNNGEAES